MDDMKIKLVMTPPVGKEQVLELDACIVGGIMGDGSDAPMGAYMGSLDMVKASMALQHITRAYVKLMQENLVAMEENGMERKKISRKEELKVIYKMALNAVDRAFKMELEDKAIHNVSLDEHIVKMRYDKRKGKK